MARWTADRIWEAVEEGRWIPPSATRVTTEEYDLAVTPGSYALTYVYGFRVADPTRLGERLTALRQRVESLGGNGARIQLTPRSRPIDLAGRLEQYGYRPIEEAEVLVWRLVDDQGGPRLPQFPDADGVSVRELESDAEYDQFIELGPAIFGDPVPPPEARARFLSEFHRQLLEDGHSGRFLAYHTTTPIGRAGLEVAGPVARLWGTGVLADYRRRGVYGALVWVRCDSAVRRGAEIALVTARVGTSGPILKRHGFEPMGPVRIFEARW